MINILTYRDIKNRDYDTLNDDYNAQYANGNGKYFSDARLVQDTRLLQHVTLDSLGFSPQDVKDELIGLNQSLIDPTTNKPYPDNLYRTVIEEAVAWAEETLDIVIRPRVVNERDDYNKTDYLNYMTIRTNARPILQIDDSRLIFNNNTVLQYPHSWIQINHRFGLFKMQPTALMASTSGGILQSPTMIFPSMSPNTGMPYGNPNFAPNLIGTSYVAGFLPRDPRDEGITRYYYVPYTLKALVDKMAAVYILQRWGRNIVGAGVAGYGISIDSISSHIETNESPNNTASSADIKLLMVDIQNNLKALRAYFGVNLGIIS